MPNHDPKLAAGLQIQSPSAGWEPKNSSNDFSTTIGNDQSGYARTTIQNGQASIESGKALRTSTADIAAAQIAQERAPYEYALDARTRCRIGPHDLKDDSIISLHGSEMTVAQARANGWLNTPSAPPNATNAPPNRPFEEAPEGPIERTNPDLHVDLLANEAIDRDYSNLVDTTGGVEQMAAIQQVVETGAIDARTLGTLATQLSCEPGQLQERIAPIMQAFEDQARAAMSEGGLDSNDVIAWAQQNRADKLNLAMNRQATQRQTAGYAALRQDYLESLAEHNPSAALSADLGPGISQRQDAKGRVIVRLATGEEMEWRTALQAFGPK